MQIIIGVLVGFGVYYCWGDIQPVVIHVMEFCTDLVRSVK